jgi:hypothetical protein
MFTLRENSVNGTKKIKTKKNSANKKKKSKSRSRSKSRSKSRSRSSQIRSRQRKKNSRPKYIKGDMYKYLTKQKPLYLYSLPIKDVTMLFNKANDIDIQTKKYKEKVVKYVEKGERHYIRSLKEGEKKIKQILKKRKDKSKNRAKNKQKNKK